MFGNNPTRPRDRSDGLVLDVFDKFETVQGEGPWAGMPALFIRLWGCHLKCYFCDTDFETVREPTELSELVGWCVDNPQPLVVLTGGEPMRQNIAPLVQCLLRRDFRVQIETAGSFWFDAHPDIEEEIRAHPDLSIVVSPKTPAVDGALAAHASAWKYIVGADIESGADGLPVCNYQDRGSKQRPLARPPDRTPPSCVYLQPLDEGDDERNARNRAHAVALAMKHGYRVSLQLHKILGLP